MCNAGESAIPPDEIWEDDITRAMDTCTLFVILGTKNYGALAGGGGVVAWLAL